MTNLSTQQITAMPIPQRLELVTLLWDSIGSDLNQTHSFTQFDFDEFDRRILGHDQQPSTSISWDALRIKLKHA